MSFILVPLATLPVYLLIAFVQWDLNAGNWSMDARFCAAMLMAVFGYGAAVTAAQLEANR
jgi:hypothetical protein